jgi:hypothetical protein
MNPMLEENGLGGEFPTYNLLGREDVGVEKVTLAFRRNRCAFADDETCGCAEQGRKDRRA